MTSSLRAHWGLDPLVTLLNHGSFGACPRSVLAAQQVWRDRMERNPVDFFQRQLEPALDVVRDALSAELGCAPGELVFVPNATSAVNAVLRSFPFAPGDELLITDHGYNACNNTARAVAEEAGARVVVAKLPFPVGSAEELSDAVLAALTPRTRLALLDHITSPTALRLPLETLVPVLAARGCEVLVDGAHAPGQLALDFAALGAAFSTGNAHKWLCAPKGAAYLHVRANWHERVWPWVVTHAVNSVREGRPRWLEAFDWPGTDDPSAVLSIPAAIDFLAGLHPGGLAEHRERNHALALRGRDLLCEAFGVAPPAPDELLGSMAVVPLPDAPRDPPPRGALQMGPLQQALYERARIEVPIVSWPTPRSRLLRVSAQAYNDVADFELLARELAALLVEEAS